jgi:hypothetical protein
MPQIDDLLQQAGVRINAAQPSSNASSRQPNGKAPADAGAAAADAVIVVHSGLALVPLEESQVEADHPLQVLAALVPVSDLVGSGSSSDSGSSDDVDGNALLEQP